MGTISNVSELGISSGFTYDPSTGNLTADGDIRTTGWTNYSSVSTISGWASYESGAKLIYYKKVGNLVFCSYYIRGVTNSSSASFTLPWASTSTYFVIGTGVNLDDSTSYIGSIYNSNGTIYICRQFSNGEFTESTVTKDCRGSFWFEASAIS
jgi:hypothetical protein